MELKEEQVMEYFRQETSEVLNERHQIQFTNHNINLQVKVFRH